MKYSLRILSFLICGLFISQPSLSQINCTPYAACSNDPNYILQPGPQKFFPFKMSAVLSDSSYRYPQLPFYSDYALEGSHPEVKRVLISLHGNGGNALRYYCTGRQLLDQNPQYAQETFVIAPQFIDPDTDGMATTFLDNRVFFWRAGRSSGSFSADTLDSNGSRFIFNYGARSYHILDALIERLADPRLFPNLEIIVFAGQSMGGRMVSRYALLNSVEERILKARNIHMRYVAMNPGTYAYIGDERYKFINSNYLSQAVNNENWMNEIAQLPDPASICSNYNAWPRGLDNISTSLSEGLSQEEIIKRFENRDVVYLIGAKDTVNGASGCDLSQGQNRLETALLHFYHLKRLYGSLCNKRIRVMAGVGHSGCNSLTSAEGVTEIFRSIPPTCIEPIQAPFTQEQIEIILYQNPPEEPIILDEACLDCAYFIQERKSYTFKIKKQPKLNPQFIFPRKDTYKLIFPSKLISSFLPQNPYGFKLKRKRNHIQLLSRRKHDRIELGKIFELSPGMEFSLMIKD